MSHWSVLENLQLPNASKWVIPFCYNYPITYYFWEIRQFVKFLFVGYSIMSKKYFRF